MRKFAIIGLLLVLTGCKGPSLVYDTPTGEADLKYAEEGHIPFQLQSTILVLSTAKATPADAVNADAANPAQPPATPDKSGGHHSGGSGGGSGGTGGDHNSGGSNPGATTPSPVNTQFAANAACASKPPAPLVVTDCLKNTAVTATAYPDDSGMHSLVAVHSWGTSTDLSPTYVGNTYMLSSVGITFTDNRTAILSSAASAAGTGFTLGGPAGAIAAAGVVLGSSAFATQSGTAQQEHPNRVQLCDDATPLEKFKPTGLALPVTLTLAELSPKLSYDKKDPRKEIDYGPFAKRDDDTKKAAYCWANLPGNPGWYYQFQFDHADDVRGSIRREIYFAQDDQANDSERVTIPYSSCRRGTLRIATSDVLLDPDPETSPVGVFPVTVGDPEYLRTMRIPVQGTITMGSVCGANLQTGTGTAAMAASAASTANQMFSIISQIRGQQTAAPSKK